MIPFVSGNAPFRGEIEHALDSEGFRSFFGGLAVDVKTFVLKFCTVILPDAGSRSLYWFYLLTTLAAALLIFAFRRGHGAKGVDGREEKRSLGRFLFPPAYFTHPSSWVDIRLYVVNALFTSLLTVYSFYTIGSVLQGHVAGALSSLFGAGPQFEATWGVKLLFSLVTLIVIDFAFTLYHYLEHTVPVLWEFHKVHHSAEVLTPITRYRGHPVGDICMTLFIGTISALPLGIFAFLVPKGLGQITVINAGVFLFLYDILSNMRHYHVSMRFPVWLEKWVQSPGMHHVHHSVLPHHWNKNLGLVLSIWDRFLFKSLYIAAKDEVTPWGFDPEEHHRYRSVRKILVTPFVNIRGMLRRPTTHPNLTTPDARP